MVPQAYYKSAFLAVIVLSLIGWFFSRSGTQAPDRSQNKSNSPSQVTAQKPIFTNPHPTDWNQPVRVIGLKDQLYIPLPITAGEEYLLIINNLQQDPHASDSISVSVETESKLSKPAGCFLQNSLPIGNDSVIELTPKYIPRPRNTETRDNYTAEDSPSPEAERLFHLFVTDGDLSDKKQYTQVKGKLVHYSDRVAIYLDDQQQPRELASGLIEEIANLLEHQILDRLIEQCGPLNDIDQSGRFTVLLSPWLAKLQGGKTSINGFVRPSDFRETVPAPFSNHCDMLYLNSTLKPGQELCDLLSHELTHAVVSSIRSYHESVYGESIRDEEDWLNEGIAHIMEPGYSNRDYRISEFYHSPESYPLVVPDYYRAQLWRNHGCRGAVNLFINWCQQLNDNRRFTYHFTHHHLTGIRKIEALTGFPFPELFRQWSVVLARQAIQSRFASEDSATNPGQHYCGRYLLAGPRLHTLNLGNKEQKTISIASTASAFLHLKPEQGQTEKAMIKIDGFTGMQLTLLKISAADPDVSLQADSIASAATDQTDTQSVKILLQCRHPEPWQIKNLHLEYSGAYLAQADRQPRSFLVEDLPAELSATPANRLEIAHLDAQNAEPVCLSEFLIRLPARLFESNQKIESVQMKAVFQTPLEQTIVVQTDVKPPSQPASRLARTRKKTSAR